MSDIDLTLVDAAARLREEFDLSFSRAHAAATGETIDLVVLRVAGEPFAARLSDLAGLHAGLKVTPCPSSAKEFRGIAGIRADLLPVYDLSQLLGGARSAGLWFVIAAAAPVAFAFDEFRMHVRIPADRIAGSAGPSRQHIHEIARSDHGVWPLIDIPSLVGAIRARVGTTTSRKEY